MDAPEGIDGTIRPSIPERSHGAGEASPDAARDVGVDGLQSSPNIGEACDVPPDDRGPSTRVDRGQLADPVGCTIPNFLPTSSALAGGKVVHHRGDDPAEQG